MVTNMPHTEAVLALGQDCNATDRGSEVPNGLHISAESDLWRALESPLVEIDELLSAFAKRHGMALSNNYHNWPERTLAWSSRGLRRSIQFALAGLEERTYSMMAYASTGAGMTWLSNESALKKAVPWAEIAADLESLLARAYETAEQWLELDLNASKRLDPDAIRRRHSR